MNVEVSFLIIAYHFYFSLVWNLEESKLKGKLQVERPTEDALFKFKQLIGDLPNYSEDHILNTPDELKKLKKTLTVYCFIGGKTFAGYEDGLICCFKNDIKSKDEETFDFPLLGHTNRVNQIMGHAKGS